MHVSFIYKVRSVAVESATGSQLEVREWPWQWSGRLNSHFLKRATAGSKLKEDVKIQHLVMISGSGQLQLINGLNADDHIFTIPDQYYTQGH